MPRRSSARIPTLGLLFCGLVVLGGTALGQTTSSLTVGGIGAFGCNVPQTDPPTLQNGQEASGTAAFSYDGATQVLTLTVTNTSPIVAGQNNPVLRRIYVNLPPLACTGATLISQTGAGGAVPAFQLSVDTDLDRHERDRSSRAASAGSASGSPIRAASAGVSRTLWRPRSPASRERW